MQGKSESLQHAASKALSAVRKPLRQRPLAIAPHHQDGSEVPDDELFEEEEASHHHIEAFYPTELGEVLLGRYQVVKKLGWGQRSTTWLANDLKRWRWQRARLVAVKIQVADAHSSRLEPSEVQNLESTKQAKQDHAGRMHVRRLLDSFQLESRTGKHDCLVFEPLRETLSEFCNRFETNKIPYDALPLVALGILRGLDYLHNECKLVHTDLKPDNVMMAFDEKEHEIWRRELLESAAQEVFEPRKHLADRTIYQSYRHPEPMTSIGRPVIIDFDMAVPGDAEWKHGIQTQAYLCPEVLFGTPWSYPADIWNLGVMLCELVEGCDLFMDGPSGTLDISRVVACLGPPPVELGTRRVRQSSATSNQGDFEFGTPLPDLNLESFITRIDGEEKAEFLRFIRRMLRWLLAERATAKELLKDPLLAYVARL